MTTLRIQNLSCPHCSNKMYTIGIMSYTIINSEAFSDGKINSNPPRPVEHRILICNSCNKAFWKDDALLDRGDHYQDNDELPEASSISDLFPGFQADDKLKQIHYYSNLLENEFANTKERAVYLRIELWHSINDIVRYKQKEMSESTKSIFDDNLEKLIDIFEPKNQEEQLFISEMYRELGAFEKALNMLKIIKVGDKDQAYLQIEKAIKMKQSTVFKII